MLRSLAALLIACLVVHTSAANPEESAVLDRSADFARAVAARDLRALQRLVHDRYHYIAPLYSALTPVPTGEDRNQYLARRLEADATAILAAPPPEVAIVGLTAVITGSYRVVERPTPAGEPRPLRVVPYGRFTETWVQIAPGQPWVLLAEHHSLHDRLEWESNIVAAQPAASATTSPPPPAPAPRPAIAADQRQQQVVAEAHRGLPPPTFTDLFRAYEPTQVGYTWDQHDDAFMDFTFSAMFPIWAPDNFPSNVRRRAAGNFFPRPTYSGFNLYGAATIRAGQYIGSRPSSPVVGKRFNPLLTARLWARDGGELVSENNFLEFVYAHESNGQFIANPVDFANQVTVYSKQVETTPRSDGTAFPATVAGRSARDNISRGWDYVGMQFARDWDTRLPTYLPWLSGYDVTVALNARFNYFLPWGLAQKHAEEFNRWEPGDGRGRRYYDGLSFRYTLNVNPGKSSDDDGQYVRRYTLTWTTGYKDPARFNTLKAEFSFALNRLPLTLWFRTGYNRDLVDYYVHDHSFGLSLSYWDF